MGDIQKMVGNGTRRKTYKPGTNVADSSVFIRKVLQTQVYTLQSGGCSGL